MMKIPDNIAPENYRFFVITQIAYIVGLTAHLALGILFHFLAVQEMAWFNFFISVPIFSAALALNRSAYLNLAFCLAIFELYFHQVAAVYFLGWESGLQYFLIYLAALPFFNARWNLRLRLVFILFICVTYVTLFTYFKVPESIRLTPFFYYVLYVSSAIATLLLLVVIINYFVRSTDRAETELKQANLNLSKKNDQIQETLKQRDKALADLDRELSDAADYVRTILPAPMSRGNIRTEWRFVPSASLGGDAFGYHWLDSKRLALYLIDVSGHGARPALLSVSVINALRSHALPDTDFYSPANVLDTLNRAFPSEQNNAMFFTIWYGVYDTDNHEMCFASGGHPPALLKPKTDEGFTDLKSLITPNPLIGAMEEAQFTELKCTIPANSMLYIFSDGVYEIEKTGGQMWHFDEFKQYMASQVSDLGGTMDRLMAHARAISDSVEFLDDFTILGVEIG